MDGVMAGGWSCLSKLLLSGKVALDYVYEVSTGYCDLVRGWCRLIGHNLRNANCFSAVDAAVEGLPLGVGRRTVSRFAIHTCRHGLVSIDG